MGTKKSPESQVEGAVHAEPARNKELEPIDQDNQERARIQTKILKNDLLMKEHALSEKGQYYFWRKRLIFLMLVIPWILFIGGVWVIFMSESIDCPKIGKCEDPELWTKNIFVSGSFVTLVSFYIALAKGLFGDNIGDKSLAEQANDTALSASKSSGG